jgi:hypothetical protein
MATRSSISFAKVHRRFDTVVEHARGAPWRAAQSVVGTCLERRLRDTGRLPLEIYNEGGAAK